MTVIHPVILCGGSGTRLWPRSRKHSPKPFLPLIGQQTLFQKSLARVEDSARFAAPIVVSGEAHTGFITEQASGINGLQLVVEPAARNTAPAIALAAHLLPPEAVMLVCPSDHHIADQSAFSSAVQKASELARDGWLVCLGIPPTRPETGFGYIKQGEPLAQGHRIARFVEKPDLERAQAYLDHGGFVWNAGIFVFTAGRFLEELAMHRPLLAGQVESAAHGSVHEGGIIHPSSTAFEQIAGESIDYAVMENTDRAAVVAADMGWSDIGNWDALFDATDRDAAGNHAPEGSDLLDCRNVMVVSDGPRVSAVGLEDVVIVVDGGEVLVTTRAGAIGRQAARRIVAIRPPFRVSA